jgi:hypothetical protein
LKTPTEVGIKKPLRVCPEKEETVNNKSIHAARMLGSQVKPKTIPKLTISFTNLENFSSRKYMRTV